MAHEAISYSSELTADRQTYNYRMCRARIVVENVFGRLKACWRRLMKRNDMFIHNVPAVAAAACVLHNICEIHHDQLNDAWLVDDNGLAQPDTSVFREVNAANSRSRQIRGALVTYFTSN